MREGGNACGGGISESTSMKEHLSVFFKKLQGERGVKS
jgi:galactitol-specific phosphotransferase system IIB component